MSRASFTAAALAALAVSATAQITYPESKKVDQVDDYHGTKVPDPYRWLEDLDSPETKAWVEAQNRVTSAFLASVPDRARIEERLTRLWNFEKYGVPFQEGGRYFFTRNDGLQDQSVLCVAESISADPRVLLDPNTLSADGTVALKGYSVSEDGRYVAYGLSSAGSDWEEWRVREIETGADLPDHLKWIKWSSAAWTHDGKGFFYGRYDEPRAGEEMSDTNYYHKLFYHRLGTPQAEDVKVYERPDEKEWGFGSSVTEDGRWLVIQVWRSSANKVRVLLKDLSVPDAPVTDLVGDFDAAYDLVGNEGPVFWFRTDLAAPRGRLVAVDSRDPRRESWKEILPQASEPLTGVSLVGDRFFATYLEHATTKVLVFDAAGARLSDVELPGIGSAWGFGGERKDRETFYAFSSYATPTTIYRYDIESGKSEVFRSPKVDFDPTAYTVEQVFYPSKDGTRIPMFLAHKKGMALDGTNPLYLYGYGGFAISMEPWFSVSGVVWMEMGGVYAVPCLRGGGEYGEEWHVAGMRAKKQNVFDDFIAAAEWLVREKYTSPAKLAIGGGSNGGLLVGACLVQRPDLFAAACPDVGVLDMLRFHKFTIGWAWVEEYGSSDDPEDFKVLLAYSPLQNVKPGASYPATFITTADHDDRVVPAHSFKFAATLQAAQAGPAPVLVRIETKAGHGAGKPTAKAIEEISDRIAFLVRVLAVPDPGAKNGK
ncbi:MAG: S9 family peptidase [Planctomycetes bacterium]|nr:S9 family peptidase [Planctomycetota bacterium]